MQLILIYNLVFKVNCLFYEKMRLSLLIAYGKRFDT